MTGHMATCMKNDSPNCPKITSKLSPTCSRNDLQTVSPTFPQELAPHCSPHCTALGATASDALLLCWPWATQSGMSVHCSRPTACLQPFFYLARSQEPKKSPDHRFNNRLFKASLNRRTAQNQLRPQSQLRKQVHGFAAGRRPM